MTLTRKLDNHHSKLRWQCRRGMLELDLILIPFFENCYATLSNSEQNEFELLLNQADTAIYTWLLDTKETSIPSNLISIVEKIRHYVHSAH